MKPLLAPLILCALLCICGFLYAVPSNPDWYLEREINGCLPTAITFRESLRKYGVWARVLLTVYVDELHENGKYKHGHAMVVFIYPSGKQRLWSYDSEGSWEIPYSQFPDPITIAKKAFEVRGQSRRVVSAKFIEE